jgi:hypothetical protein
MQLSSPRYIYATFIYKGSSRSPKAPSSVPSIPTREKYANALRIPLYRFFTDEETVVKPKLPRSDDSSSWGAHGKERDAFQTLARALARMDDQDQKLLLSMAQGMARRGAKR